MGVKWLLFVKSRKTKVKNEEKISKTFVKNAEKKQKC